MPRGTDCTDATKMYRTAVQDHFPEKLTIKLQRESSLRYGENPHQAAALYRLGGCTLAEVTNIRLAKTGKGGLSATNLMDITRAMEMLKFFRGQAVAVMKHVLPSGMAGFAAQQESLDRIYLAARDADKRSAFGSVVVSNRPIDVATAEAITSTFVEVVAAPDYGPGAMAPLEKKGDLRVALFSNLDQLPKWIDDGPRGLVDIRTLPTGRVLVQEVFRTRVKSANDLITDPLVKDAKTGETFVVARDPTPSQMEDMLMAWYINAVGARSNGLVFVKDQVTLAVGAGQQERVGAGEQGITKSYQKEMDRSGIRYDPLEGANRNARLLSASPLEGAVVSSDGFFPFRDSIDMFARVGIAAVIQPGGSKKDSEVIQAVNEHQMAMAFTLERCFAHF